MFKLEFILSIKFILFCSFINCDHLWRWMFDAKDSFKLNNGKSISRIQCFLNDEPCNRIYIQQVDCLIRFENNTAINYYCFQRSVLNSIGIKAEFELICTSCLNGNPINEQPDDCYVRINLTDLDKNEKKIWNKFRMIDCSADKNADKNDANISNISRFGKNQNNLVTILLILVLAIFFLITIPIILMLIGCQGFCFCFNCTYCNALKSYC